MVDSRRRSASLSPPRKVALRSNHEYERCAVRLKALADPGRLRIVNLLLRGAKNVSELAQELDTAVVNVSHHLQVLRRAELLQACKRGKFVVYSVQTDITNGPTGRDPNALNLGCCTLELSRSQS